MKYQILAILLVGVDYSFGKESGRYFKAELIKSLQPTYNVSVLCTRE